MFGSTALDVALGLVSLYLLLSLIITTTMELIETTIKLRAAHLGKGIEKLLGSEMATRFFDQTLIKSLSPDKWSKTGTRLPSYIPSRTFATTVIDMVTKNVPAAAGAIAGAPKTMAEVRDAISKLPDGDLRDALTVLLTQSQDSLEKLEENVEVWFNNQMERVGGWYKRKVQLITLGMALVITICLNADTILIAHRLSNDATLRQAVVAQAQEIAKQPLDQGDRTHSGEGPSDPVAEIGRRKAALQERIDAVQGLGMPLGFPLKPEQSCWFLAVLGWLLTALAISLGAPFWFDILNKVVSIRSTGKAPEESPKPPKEEPKPLGPGETPEEKRAAEDRRIAALVAGVAAAVTQKGSS